MINININININMKARPTYTDNCEDTDNLNINVKINQQTALNLNCQRVPFRLFWFCAVYRILSNILPIVLVFTVPLPNSGRHATALHPVKEMELKQPDYIPVC
ncbi:hypothetical protein DPMN_049430 [Dreissena polymorpha]|uniref:Uncharacterized protein n=1 Tax=Dreissena polymorpha TaxID=45954 RepID=A0A9D4CG39_DREPO|nr:hypothetical protein DPMN_049430 [Dreissena polymorpha]